MTSPHLKSAVVHFSDEGIHLTPAAAARVVSNLTAFALFGWGVATVFAIVLLGRV